MTLSGITGEGALGISLPPGTAVDIVGNLAVFAFQSTLFLVDNTAPSVTISDPSVAIATTGDTVSYTVTYADANFDMATLTSADITVVPTGTAGATTVTVTPVDATHFTVTLSGLSGDGAIAITIAAGTANDLAANSADGTAPSATFTVDNTKPTITISVPSVSTTPGGPVSFTITMTDANPDTFSLTAA